MKKHIAAVLCCILIVTVLPPAARAIEDEALSPTVQTVGEYLCRAVSQPCVGSVGGEWAVIGLARSGLTVPEGYYETYYQMLEQYVKQCDGVLHKVKYTEYARVILAVTAIGKNPADVGGYNLLAPLGDYKKTIKQGINGAVWALIALDSGNYDMPVASGAEVQATRELYVDYILSRRTSDGGWAMSGDAADPDMTGMALQALAKYQSDSRVSAATEQALACMSAQQNENGGFWGLDGENAESCAQMLVALCELGLSPDDARFVKNGHTMLNNLLTFYDDNGGFCHVHDGGVNQMATEQCFYTLVALKRRQEGQSSLYRMAEAVAAVPHATGQASANAPMALYETAAQMPMQIFYRLFLPFLLF